MPPPSFVTECAYKSLVRKHAHILKVATEKRREKVTMKINCKKKKVRAMRYESKSFFCQWIFLHEHYVSMLNIIFLSFESQIAVRIQSKV